jgi:DNA-directed RNA polymerase specialized sigma24 family protein
MHDSHRPAPSSALDALLTDNAWFARLTAALVAGDAESRRPAPTWSAVTTARDAVDRAELRLTLLNSLLALDEPYRSVVVLHLLEGRDAATIARITNVGEGTVLLRIRSGVARLKASCSA